MMHRSRPLKSPLRARTIMCGAAFAMTSRQTWSGTAAICAARRGPARGSRPGSMSAAGPPCRADDPRGAPATSPIRCGSCRTRTPTALHTGRRRCAAKHDRGPRRRGADRDHRHGQLPTVRPAIRESSPNPLHDQVRIERRRGPGRHAADHGKGSCINDQKEDRSRDFSIARQDQAAAEEAGL